MVAYGDAGFCGRQRFLDVVNAVQRAECTTVERFVGWREGGGSGVEREDRGGNRRDDPRDVPACEYMHLTNTLITAAGPYRRRAAKSARGKSGVQVDLMLQTRRSLWIVEVKRKREIDREIETEVERKAKALSRPEGVSSKMALVYDGHLSPLVEADGYFDAIVPFKSLLGLN